MPACASASGQISAPVDKWTMYWGLSQEEVDKMAERLGKVSDLMRSFAFVGLQRTMSAFNNT